MPDCDPTIVGNIEILIKEGKLEPLKKFMAEHPAYLHERYAHETWLHRVARRGTLEMAKYFVEMGISVHAKPDNPLDQACGSGNLEIVRYLLEQGADPNVGRLFIAAMNAEKHQFEIVKLLVEYGSNVNQCWRWMEEADGLLFNALFWAEAGEHHEIAEYLRKHGAKLPEELFPEEFNKKKDQSAKSARPLEEQIIEYFTDHIGPVKKLAIREIVASNPSISIHMIAPTKDRPYLVLFTTGMSTEPMNVPEGEEDYRYAELVFFLPGDWPMTKQTLKEIKNSWPLIAMRKIALYPHAHEIGIGATTTIITNDDPPRPYAPDSSFASMLLLCDFEDGPIVTDDRTIHLYTMIPLYNEERDLESKEGLVPLMQGLDRHKISKVFDPRRLNVAK